MFKSILIIKLMYKMDKSVLLGTSLSALSIIGGVSLKNTYKHLGQEALWNTLLGMILFVGGWIGIGYYTVGANNDTSMLNKSAIVLSILLIIGAVMYQNLADSPSMAIMLPLFIGGWLLFGLSAGLGSDTSLSMTLLASILVILSMVFILPLQRGGDLMGYSWTTPENKIVDGVGYTLFTVAWGLISLSNAMA